MTIKKLLMACALACSGSAFAFMPQAGTWIVASENTGQPGRGFGLDVQNNTLVMQMYGYEANGTPTFYLSAGTIANNAYAGQLNKYAGGQSFGSAPHAGYETGSAGQVQMRFVSGIKGYITFPGESEKEIQRFSFAYSETPQSLLGTWALMSANPTSGAITAIFGNITYISGQTAFSSDGSMGCRYTGYSKGEVLCALSQGGKVAYAAKFTLSVNDGEGFGGQSSFVEPVTVRRLANPLGDPVGLIIGKDMVAQADSLAAIDVALDELLASAKP